MREVNLLEQLRKNWVIIVFITGCIVGWTNIQGRLSQNELDIVRIRTDLIAIQLKVDNSQEQVSSIQGDIKEIKASLSFIRDRLTK